MSTVSASVANKFAEQGFVFIGHDVDGWTVALIAAGIAAAVYEAVTALTKMVTLRIPFLVLQIARVITPKAVRASLYRRWKSHLWYILNGEELWLIKFLKGMWFALQLAVCGARLTAAALRSAEVSSRMLLRIGTLRVAVGVIALGWTIIKLTGVQGLVAGLSAIAVLLVGSFAGAVVSLMEDAEEGRYR